MVASINAGRSAGGTTPNINTSKLSSEKKQLVDETMSILKKDKYAANMLSKVADKKTPISFDNGGLKGQQAAGTQISSDGTSKVTLGTEAIDKAKDKTGKMKAIAGMMFNEFHSVVSVGDMAKNGKGTKNSQTKSQEWGSFFSDGYAQSLIAKSAGDSVPTSPKTGDTSDSKITVKDANKELEKEYGKSLNEVMNKSGSYAKLPPGNISDSGLDELAKNQALPEDFVAQAKDDLKQGLSNSGGGNSAKGKVSSKTTSKLSAEAFTQENQGGKTTDTDKKNTPDQKPETNGELTLKG